MNRAQRLLLALPLFVVVGCAVNDVTPVGPGIGEPCSDRCAACVLDATGRRSVCTAFCTNNESCPDGFSCEPWPLLDSPVCVPEGGSMPVDAGTRLDMGPRDMGTRDSSVSDGGTEDLGEADDASTGECTDDELLCDGTCARCPSATGVEAFACSGAACVIENCTEGYELCVNGCCSWTTETLASDGDVGRYASLALASDGTIHVSYYAITSSSFAWLRRAEGEAPVIETIDDRGQPGGFSAMVLDSSDIPHFSYYSVTDGELRYARRDPGELVREVVDTDGDVGWFSSIALDSSGSPRIAYHSYEPLGMRFASRASSWSHETVFPSDGDIGQYASLVIIDDAPWIAYRDEGDMSLVVAHKSGSSWVREIVDTAGNPGDYASMALGPDGQPRVAYYAETDGDLRLATRGSSGTWSVETVDPLGNAGTHPALAIASDGTNIIAYRDEDYDALLVYRELPDGRHYLTFVDEEGDAGQFASMVLDEDELPIIAYYAATPGDLRLARLR